MILNNNDNDRTITMGDFNSKSNVWSPRETDRRGEEALNFISRWNISVVNDPNSIPTHSCTKRESSVDLTLTRNIDDRHIREWKVLDQETLRDHRLILTEVNFQKNERTELRKILKLQDMKILDFKTDLKELINTFSEADITNEIQEDYIDKFYEGFYLICEIDQKNISENKRKKMQSRANPILKSREEKSEP
ncbi:hypothetical protein AVEN_177297-1 [Araneus ventricosus]|uniref:Endonuclease/exonuclease/phosphatase domain-containing protein n=1 Tax=Araneus ventricosus TaxID=182803 RepID=A0A4Y2C5A2_ARAVE|nr:hypothetical protein AVEN_177297-1 [Araneus ventricosus]